MGASIESFLTLAEQKLDGFAKSIVQKAENAQVQAHLGLMDLNEHWSANQDAMLRSAAKIKAAGSKVQTGVDEVRVKAHLAKSDTIDAVANIKGRIHRIEGRLEFLKVSLTHDSHAAIERVGGACQNLRKQLDA